MTLAQRLLARLRADPQFDIPDGASCVRLNRGRHGISAGTWAWHLVVIDADGLHRSVGTGFGSEDTMRACVVAVSLGSYVDRGASVNVSAEDR